MWLLNYWFVNIFVSCALCIGVWGDENLKKVKYQYDIEKWLNDVNVELSSFNSVGAHLTWTLSTNPDEKSSENARLVGKVRNKWKNTICATHIKKDWLTDEQRRKIYLLCRGPNFTDNMLLEYLEIAGQLVGLFNSPVCFKENGFPLNNSEKTPNFPKIGDCLYGEPDLENIMKNTNLSPSQLKWIWLNWHDSVGPKIKPIYKDFMDLQNEGARTNGYSDMGEIWREELEIPDLEQFVFDLYSEVEPLYVLLHAVVRHRLLQKYGPKEIDPRGPIPVHLLGNMWGQDWGPLIDLFDIPKEDYVDLEGNLQRKKQTVKEMVLEAEDFYTSLTLPKMTNKFWKYSIFEETENSTICHGTAANLYSPEDFRMLMCGKVSMYDFYVIHHEMGHIQYYMAYSEQPAIFQDGTNSAFHESIGDSIMHGVTTPQHLHRIRLLTDDQLLNNKTVFFLLLQKVLTKIPEIPFSLIIDKFRWEMFRNNVPFSKWNDYYWSLSRKYRGVVPPEDRSGDDLFDAAGKFHIPDNTPYVRYFLSSILQMQLFESFCRLSLYGKVFEEKLEYLPLHRCDIYGSKIVGKKLLEMMSKGASIQWPEALNILTGNPQISTEPFLRYYKPIYEWLQSYIDANDVYVGW